MAFDSALVLGATGSFGGAVLEVLARRGWRVDALVRDERRLMPRLAALPPVGVVAGDAEDAAAVAAAARGKAAIIHGVNYPYDRWIPHMRRVTEAVIAAAEATGATIVFPGNVYGFGPPRDRPLVESDEPRPTTRKGRLRVELERLLAEAAARGRARVIVVRAGDYFGPTVRNGFVDPIFGNARRGRPMTTFGNLGIPHQWAYVPDVARLAVDLLERRSDLRPFETVHLRGHVVESERRLCRLAAAAAGRPNLALIRLPWWLLRLVALGDGTVREVMEMRYLFDESVVIDDPRRRELLPDFATTPLENAIADTVKSYSR
jgi:nucleoside-diphosphate-sugar epimerase